MVQMLDSKSKNAMQQNKTVALSYSRDSDHLVSDLQYEMASMTASVVVLHIKIDMLEAGLFVQSVQMKNSENERD